MNKYIGTGIGIGCLFIYNSLKNKGIIFKLRHRKDIFIKVTHKNVHNLDTQFTTHFDLESEFKENIECELERWKQKVSSRIDNTSNNPFKWGKIPEDDYFLSGYSVQYVKLLNYEIVHRSSPVSGYAPFDNYITSKLEKIGQPISLKQFLEN